MYQYNWFKGNFMKEQGVLIKIFRVFQLKNKAY